MDDHRGQPIRRAVCDALLPDYGKRLLPRLYAPVDGYRWMAVAESIMMQIGGFEKAITSGSAHRDSLLNDSVLMHLYATGSQAAHYGMPTYFVGHDMLTALELSRIPINMPASELLPPFPAMVFVLPQAMALRAPDGTGYEAIVTGIVAPGAIPPIDTRNTGNRHLLLHGAHGDIDQDSYVTAFAIPTSDSPVYGSFIPLRGTLGDMTDDEQLGEFASLDYSSDTRVRLAATETAFNHHLLRLAIRLMMMAGHRDDHLVEGPAFLRRARFGPGSDKHKNDLWTPHWLGRTYRLPTPPTPRADGCAMTRSSPRAHWRCGHIRRVRCGPGRQEHKSIWLPPTLVSAPAVEPTT